MITLAIDPIGHFYSNGSHCIFDDNAATGTIPIPIYWVLVIDVVSSIGTFIATCSMFQFAMAQTPNQMRGIIMRLVFAMVGLGSMHGKLFFNMILHHQLLPAVCFTTTWYYHYSCC